MKESSVNIHREVQPEWFRQSRLGIFIHWGLYSVPAFAPTGKPFQQKDNPYAEWYHNSMNIKGSPTNLHHREQYGNMPYSAFAEDFRQSARDADPEAWARLFKDAGASYAVLVTKHHDGFMMYDSAVMHPRLGSYGLDFDFCGELAKACRKEGLRFGTYYSSLLDWTFSDKTIRSTADLYLSPNIERDYLDYCRDHWLELIDRYEPDILWSDIGYPPDGRMTELFSYYYSKVPQGLVNDRWRQMPAFMRTKFRKLWDINWFYYTALNIRNLFAPNYYDYRTQEYSKGNNPGGKCFEYCRGIDHSFGYNKNSKPENFMTAEEVRALMAKLTANNGRLLLNVGPDMHGNIPEPQARVLRDLQPVPLT